MRNFRCLAKYVRFILDFYRVYEYCVGTVFEIQIGLHDDQDITTQHSELRQYSTYELYSGVLHSLIC
jgi:hypothetical protein